MKKIFFLPTDYLLRKKKDIYLLDFFNKQKNNNNHVINIEANHYKLNNQARKLENKLCRFLFSKLNNIHQTNLNYRQWNIILGYWIRRYSNVLTFRYYLIDQLNKKYRFNNFVFYLNHTNSVCNKNSYSFIKSTNNILWNDIFFCKIISLKKKLDKKKIKINFLTKKKFIIKNFFPYKNRNFLLKIIDPLLSIFSKKKDCVIKINKFGYLNNFLLSFKLKQIFRFYNFPDENKIKSANYTLRNKIIDKIEIKKFNEFNVAKKLLFEYLPETYLENFKNNINKLATINAPTNPAKIITDNDFDTNELFKFWTAFKIKKKAKYYILQHGNNYGTSIHTINNPELSVCDKFFSWGWSDNKKIYKGFNYQVDKKNYNNLLPFIYLYLDAKNDLDLTFNTNKVWLNYIRQNYIFLKNLSNFKNFKIIPHPYYLSRGNLSDYGELLEFKKYFSFNQNKTVPKLAIYGYDSTGFLNRICANVPTVAFFKLNNFNLRKNIIKDYLMLKNSKLIFENPKELSIFLNANDIYLKSWWFDKFRQKKINIFINKYSRYKENKIEEIKKFIIK